MDNSDFQISINIESTDISNNNDSYNIAAPAQVTYKNGSCYVKYSAKVDSSEITELMKITPENTLIICKNQNNIKNRYEYKLNYTCPIMYKTEYGNIPLEFRTQYLKIHRRSDEISIKVIYEVLYLSEINSKNTMNIKITGKDILNENR